MKPQAWFHVQLFVINDGEPHDAYCKVTLRHSARAVILVDTESDNSSHTSQITAAPFRNIPRPGRDCEVKLARS